MANTTGHSKKGAGRARTRRPPHRNNPTRTPPLPARIARLRKRLRATLETMGFRESGGAYTPDICPAGQEDRRGKKWLGRKGDPDRICQRCFMEGKPYPTAA